MASSPWCAAASNPTLADGASRRVTWTAASAWRTRRSVRLWRRPDCTCGLNGLVGLYSETGLHVAVAVYAAEVMCGKLEAGHDAQGAAFFEIGDMPPLPFPHDYRILEDWLAFRVEC